MQRMFIRRIPGFLRIAAIIFLFPFILSGAAHSKQKDYARWVNPFIGTGGHGHTFPGAVYPFGLVQLSPDTRLKGWDSCAGYHYSDSLIYGFSHTHLSGTGIPDYCDILFMPSMGPIYFDNGTTADLAHSYPSTFRHETEIAEPGYYRVLLEKHKILAELTVTPRCGFHRYTFPQAGKVHLLIDLVHRDPVVDSYLRVVNPYEIEGYRISSSWAKDQRVFFVARFSQPILSYELLSGRTRTQDLKEARGDSVKAALIFRLKARKTLLVKVGISAVDLAGARKNLEQELSHWDFDRVRQEARQAWNRELGKIEVDGGTEDEKIIFYTALYHAFIHPGIFSDVDGRYRGMDGKIYRSDSAPRYTVFSLWDTFRALHPLFTLIQPERNLEMIRTLLAQYREGGRLPKWELAGNYTGTMIGYHAIPVIVDSYVKGLRSFPEKLALEAMLHSAMQDANGLSAYRRKGFIASTDAGESVSRTLEFAYDDWCIARMAKLMGEDSLYQVFIRRAQSYKHLFDPSTRFMRARVNGGWFTPFDPFEVNFNYTEANAWQYAFFVPHDLQGLIRLMGREQIFEGMLDFLFLAPSHTTGRNQPDISGMIGQYAHGNEPSHHLAFLYNYIGKPWKTQSLVRQILTELYKNAPDGLPGNEDCGQMSAWYILAACGIYPVIPGSGDYVLTSPLFDRIVFHLPEKRTFEIRVRRSQPDDFYIRKVTLNGKIYPYSFITHRTLVKGGQMTFDLGPQPDSTWASAPSHRPVSAIIGADVTPAPFILPGTFAYRDRIVVTLGCADPDADIHYTLDGSTPTRKSPRYRSPIPLEKSVTIKAIAYSNNGLPSPVVVATYKKVEHNWKLTLHSRYAGQYSAGGPGALIDGILGGTDFRTGQWQGFEGQDLVAVLDLGRPMRLKKIRIGFLQDVRSWIFFPPEVQFFLSLSGTEFHPAGTVKNRVSDRTEQPLRQTFSLPLKGKRARYIKIVAKYYGPCPPWHPGAGGKTWLFADEIEVETEEAP